MMFLASAMTVVSGALHLAQGRVWGLVGAPPGAGGGTGDTGAAQGSLQ